MAVNNGAAFAHFGRQDITTQISVTTNQPLKQKFPTDSDISSQSAIYRFPDSTNQNRSSHSRKLTANQFVSNMAKSANQNTSSHSRKLSTNQFGSNKAIPQYSGVLSTSQIRADIVNIGNNLNPNVNALNLRTNTNLLPSFSEPQPRNVITSRARTTPSNDILIYPQEVMTKRDQTRVGGSYRSHNIPVVSKNYPLQQSNNVQSGGPGTYAGTNGNLPNQPTSSSQQRPITLLTYNKRNGDAFNANHGFQDVYVHEDNTNVEYDLITPEISYSFDTATKITPHDKSSVQKTLAYQNEVVDDDRRVVVPTRKENEQLPASKNIYFC